MNDDQPDPKLRKRVERRRKRDAKIRLVSEAECIRLRARVAELEAQVEHSCG